MKSRGYARRGDNPRDALAAKYFPAEWAAVAKAIGARDARWKLRRAAEMLDEVDRLREAGASCGTCAGFVLKDSGMICEPRSNPAGDRPAEAAGLCWKWKARE